MAVVEAVDVTDATLGATNPVMEFLRAMANDTPAVQIHYRGKYYTLDDPEIPFKCALGFVRSQLKALEEEVKAHQG